jgi:CRISPR/Cas system-associated exonuclease Cas4 (RecB family)
MLSTEAGLRRGQLLRDDALALHGRPDYVFTRKVRLRKRVFTAEFKSRTAPRRPFRGHVLQTAAGIHLARVHYGGSAANSGYPVYLDSSVEIVLTPALVRELEGAVAAVHTLYASPVPPARNHSRRARCATCPFSGEAIPRLLTAFRTRQPSS